MKQTKAIQKAVKDNSGLTEKPIQQVKEEEILAKMESQVKKWKRLHGRVFLFMVGEIPFFFRKPDMKVMSAMSAVSKKDDVKGQEVFFSNCLLNKENIGYKDDVDVMMSLGPHLEGLVETYQVKVKEL